MIHVKERDRERENFLWKGKPFHDGAVSGRTYILISFFSCSYLCLFPTPSGLCASVKQKLPQGKLGNLLYARPLKNDMVSSCSFSKNTCRWPCEVAFQPASSQIRGFPLPSFGKAGHVYQEEK